MKRLWGMGDKSIGERHTGEMSKCPSEEYIGEKALDKKSSG